METTPLTKSPAKNEESFKIKFGSQYYLVLANILFGYTVYVFLNFYLSIYYIKVVELTDIQAGIATSMNSFQVLFLFLIGGLSEYLGVRDSAILASVIAIVDLCLLIFIKNIYFQVLFIGIGLTTVIELISIAMKIGVILTTTDNNRSQGFSLYASTKYMTIVIFGPLAELVIRLQGNSYSAFHTIFIILIIEYILVLVLNLCYSSLVKPWRTDPTLQNPLQLIKNEIFQKRYWKLIAVDTIGSIQLGCLYQFGFVLPIYLTRELGESSNYGFLIGTFALITVILCPVLTPLVSYFSIYNCIIIGGVVIGIAPLVFVMGNDYYVIAAYMIINSAGGAIFESRIFDYNGKVSKNNSQGVYLALVGLMNFFCPVTNGIFGGLLLNYFCPEDGERRSWIMWYCIGGFSMFGSFLLYILKKYLEDREDEVPELDHLE